MAASWDNSRSKLFQTFKEQKLSNSKDMFLRKEKDERLNSFWESSQILKSKSDYEISEQPYYEYRWKTLEESEDKANSVLFNNVLSKNIWWSRGIYPQN